MELHVLRPLDGSPRDAWPCKPLIGAFKDTRTSTQDTGIIETSTGGSDSICINGNTDGRGREHYGWSSSEAYLLYLLVALF
jgi:hypothetical protein